MKGMRFPRFVLAPGVMLAALEWGAAGHAATIMVGQGNSYTKIKAAGAGDEVVVAPGT